MSKKNEIIKNRIADSLEYIIYVLDEFQPSDTKNQTIKDEIKLNATLAKDLLKYLK